MILPPRHLGRPWLRRSLGALLAGGALALALAAPSAFAAPSPSPAPSAPAASPGPTPEPSISPTPSPSPTDLGVVDVSPAAAAPGQSVSAQGSGFPPAFKGDLTLGSTKLGTVTADATGAWTLTFPVPTSAAQGVSSICVDSRCADFTVLAPQPSPTPTSSSSPSAGPSPSAAPTAVPAFIPPRTQSPLAVLIEPPFVFFPILLLLGLIGLGIYLWRRRSYRTPPRVVFSSTARMSSRPAGPATPPPAPPTGPPAPKGPEAEPPAPSASGDQNSPPLTD